MKPKGHLGPKNVSNFVPKITGKSRFPEWMTKRHCLYPPEYLVQRHLCFIEGVSLPLAARTGFLAERNLLRFHYTWLNKINSTEIEALWPPCISCIFVLPGQSAVVDNFL